MEEGEEEVEKGMQMICKRVKVVQGYKGIGLSQEVEKGVCGGDVFFFSILRAQLMLHSRRVFSNDMMVEGDIRRTP